MKTKVYNAYSEENDMTFILEDTYNGDTVVKTEVKGFYYGTPSIEANCGFYGKLTAEFEL